MERLLYPRAFHRRRAAFPIVSLHRSCHGISTGVFSPVALFPTTLPVFLCRLSSVSTSSNTTPTAGASSSGPLQLLHPGQARRQCFTLPSAPCLHPYSKIQHAPTLLDPPQPFNLSTSQLLLTRSPAAPSHILYSPLCLHHNSLAPRCILPVLLNPACPHREPGALQSIA